MSEFLKEVQAEIERVKDAASREAQDLADRVLREAQRLVSQKSVRDSESTLGVKTGRLRQALRKRMVQLPDGTIEFEIYFDATVAPHAKYVIQGTRYIKPHPILDIAADRVGGDDNLEIL